MVDKSLKNQTKTKEPCDDWEELLLRARNAVNELSSYANDTKRMTDFYEINRAWHILFNISVK